MLQDASSTKEGVPPVMDAANTKELTLAINNEERMKFLLTCLLWMDKEEVEVHLEEDFEKSPSAARFEKESKFFSKFWADRWKRRIS
ncbi:hypothetical protein VNO80_10055 [Phaseolus coccineus]|uniref:Uncharacterized protein n=1 Tax=Phaseolus coccineus TaxID=3886 RepID=A0AAN9NDT4_PHACN